MYKLRKKLIEDGFIKFQNLIDKKLLKKINDLSSNFVLNQNTKEKKKQISTGSMISVEIDEIFLKLIVHKDLMKTFKKIGYSNPKWSSGYIIGKVKNPAPLYWHTDWWAWDDPISFVPDPTMIFVMFYLTDTYKENGCLRVIPGSHLKYNKVHKSIKQHHSFYRLYKNPKDPVFQSVSDEIDVPSSLGDVIIGDGRLLHAAHPNLSNNTRIVITLWYYPNFDNLPDHIKASSQNHHKWPKNWTEKSKKILKKYFPQYSGNSKKIKWNRIRGS